VGGVAFRGRWVSHSSGGGVILAVCIMTEAGMLEGMFTFGAMDEGLRRPIKTDGMSLDDLGVGGLSRKSLIGGVESRRSQDAIL